MTNETSILRGIDLMRAIYEGKTIVNNRNEVLNDWYLRQFPETMVFNARKIDSKTIQVWRVPIFKNLLNFR